MPKILEWPYFFVISLLAALPCLVCGCGDTGPDLTPIVYTHDVNSTADTRKVAGFIPMRFY